MGGSWFKWTKESLSKFHTAKVYFALFNITQRNSGHKRAVYGGVYGLLQPRASQQAKERHCNAKKRAMNSLKELSFIHKITRDVRKQ